MIAALALALLLVVVIAIGRWRWGLMGAVVVGFAQDPVRKLLPERPVILVTLVAGVVLVSIASALARGHAARLRTALAGYAELRLPVMLFAVVVVVQSARTSLVYGNRTLAGIGMLGYLMPLVAVGAFYLLALDWRDARRWLTAYVLGAGVSAATVVVHFLGVRSTLFDSISLDTVYGVGGRIQMYCGILRGSEFAAFHAATAACLTLAWISGSRSTRGLLPASALTAMLLLAVILSGRRKMLAQLALFVVLFLYLEGRSRGRTGRVFTSLAALGLVGGLIWIFAVPDTTSMGLTPYLVRGGSVFEDAFDRLLSMTIGSFEQVLANVGFFGAGAGVASQGSQYFSGAGQVQLIWSNTEGGLGRVLAELGVPGFLILVALAATSLTVLRRIIRFAARLDTPDAHLVLAIAAILPSNAAVFVSAQQLYGDPFVLVVLGALFGLCLGFPPSIALQIHAARPSVPPARSNRRAANSSTRTPAVASETVGG